MNDEFNFCCRTARFARLEREKTGSFMTYQLPYPMPDEEVDEFVERILPDWEIIHTSPDNPDES